MHTLVTIVAEGGVVFPGSSLILETGRRFAVVAADEPWASALPGMIEAGQVTVEDIDLEVPAEETPAKPAKPAES